MRKHRIGKRGRGPANVWGRPLFRFVEIRPSQVEALPKLAKIVKDRSFSREWRVEVVGLAWWWRERRVHPKKWKEGKKSTAPLSLHHAYPLTPLFTYHVYRSPRLLAFHFDALGSLLPPERPKLRVPRASPSQLGLVHVAIGRRERIGVFCLHAAHCRFGACSFLLSSWRGTQAIPWLIPSDCNLSS